MRVAAGGSRLVASLVSARVSNMDGGMDGGTDSGAAAHASLQARAEATWAAANGTAATSFAAHVGAMDALHAPGIEVAREEERSAHTI